MTIDPSLTKTEIIAKITAINEELTSRRRVGDEISSAGSTIKYNNDYNHLKKDLEQLYAMKANLIARGEW